MICVLNIREVFYWQLLDDLWHKLRKNTAVSDIVLALHHYREPLSPFSPRPLPSLTLDTSHAPLLFLHLPLVSHAAPATAGNTCGLCPGRGTEEGLCYEPGASFVALLWMKSILFTHQCRHNLRQAPLLPFLFNFVLK